MRKPMNVNDPIDTIEAKPLRSIYASNEYLFTATKKNNATPHSKNQPTARQKHIIKIVQTGSCLTKPSPNKTSTTCQNIVSTLMNPIQVLTYPRITFTISIMKVKLTKGNSVSR